MKKILLLIPFLVFEVQYSKAQDSLEWTREEYKILQEKQSKAESDIRHLKRAINEASAQLHTLSKDNQVLSISVDSLRSDFEKLSKVQEADRNLASRKIGEAQESIIANQTVIENRTLYGGLALIVLVVIIALVIWWLIGRIRRGNTSLDEIRKAQDALQNAQVKMQEESIKLDNKLLEVAEQQMKAASVTANNNAASIDHSLALKVADEIVRIELNLSRMDSSIKGYKQLAKAVQRIKDNFQANGYEIVDMLGKPYVVGMKAVVTFVIDENLLRGQQIITKVIKPQINYQQQMIQAAQIEVSQSEQV